LDHSSCKILKTHQKNHQKKKRKLKLLARDPLKQIVSLSHMVKEQDPMYVPLVQLNTSNC
jgi:hypothetical protein